MAEVWFTSFSKHGWMVRHQSMLMPQDVPYSCKVSLGNMSIHLERGEWRTTSPTKTCILGPMPTPRFDTLSPGFIQRWVSEGQL